ncbi:MAG: tryptophan 7-halogenase [Pyrinomonadaceae bacterium]|nr:tryptophan 7-halogenase [Pyrinomonadaceae bacterium]
MLDLAGRHIKNIAVIGGGTAGYLTALVLNKILPDIETTVIESSKIPIIGVGEATTPKLLRVLHEVLQIDQHEFHESVSPTWKLGVRFFWGRSPDSVFNNPFGLIEPIEAQTYTGDIDNSSLISQLMCQDKSLVFKNTSSSDPKMLAPRRSYAYHIDNAPFVKYLRTQIQKSAIKQLDREIVEVNKKGDDVEYLRTDKGEKLEFDMFIDCSGFHAILSKDKTNSDFISYRSSLFTDRAITGQLRNDGHIKPYTSAITMDHGWLWNTPLQDEDHLGYVYSSGHCSDDEARDELIRKIPGLNLDDRVIRFSSGRQKSFFQGNAVKIGNSYGFIEPLESTGIHMICAEIIELVRTLKQGPPTESSIRDLNESIGSQWDMLRWFMTVHFKYNKKAQTPFWQDCNHHAETSGIQDYIDYFKEYGPITLKKDSDLYEKMNKDSIFSAFSFDLFMLAQNAATVWKYENYGPEEKTSFIEKAKVNRVIAEKALPSGEALEAVAEHPDLLTLKGWFGPTF